MEIGQAFAAIRLLDIMSQKIQFVRYRELCYIAVFGHFRFTFAISSDFRNSSLTSDTDFLKAIEKLGFNVNCTLGDFWSCADYIEQDQSIGSLCLRANRGGLSVQIKVEPVNFLNQSIDEVPDLLEKQVLYALNAGMRQVDVAQQFGISQSRVSKILNKYRKGGIWYV